MPLMGVGINVTGLKTTPGKFRLFNSIARSCLLIHGAPNRLKGFSVPLPSLTLVPSSRHIPG